MIERGFSKLLLVVLVLAAITLFFIWMGFLWQGNDGYILGGKLEYEMSTDKDVYMIGESVKITYTVTNNSSKRKEFTKSASLIIKVMQGDERVGGTFCATDVETHCGDAPNIKAIDPGQKVTLETSWAMFDQRKYSEDIQKEDYATSGTYTITAFLYNHVDPAYKTIDKNTESSRSKEIVVSDEDFRDTLDEVVDTSSWEESRNERLKIKFKYPSEEPSYQEYSDDVDIINVYFGSWNFLSFATSDVSPERCGKKPFCFSQKINPNDSLDEIREIINKDNFVVTDIERTSVGSLPAIKYYGVHKFTGGLRAFIVAYIVPLSEDNKFENLFIHSTVATILYSDDLNLKGKEAKQILEERGYSLEVMKRIYDFEGMVRSIEFLE